VQSFGNRKGDHRQVMDRMGSTERTIMRQLLYLLMKTLGGIASSTPFQDESVETCDMRRIKMLDFEQTAKAKIRSSNKTNARKREKRRSTIGKTLGQAVLHTPGQRPALPAQITELLHNQHNPSLDPPPPPPIDLHSTSTPTQDNYSSKEKRSAA
jgi:hypothetical protein